MMQEHIQDIPSPVDAYETIFVTAMFDELARTTVNAGNPREGERLLDLACGTGIVARRAAPLLGENGAVVAVDVSPEMLAKARSLRHPSGARIEWREGDAMNLDLPEDAFDIATCQQGLQYLSDPAKGVAECKRVLTDRGRAIFSTWRSLEHSPLFEELVAVEARHLEELGVTYKEIAEPFLMDDTSTLHRLFEAAGFGEIAITEATVEARFPSATNFVEDVEVAYASLMPQFAEDPRAFRNFVEKVERDMSDVVEHYRDGDGVRFPMRTHITTARC